ncbi:hypothetical protein ACTJNK_29825 [Achromobacter anxifer]
MGRATSIVRLRQRDRVIVPERTNVDQRVPVVAPRALEEASSLINLGVDCGKHDFQPAVSAFPHGALPHTMKVHLNAHAEH